MPPKRELTACQKAERSIQKTYRDRLWTPFINALKTYDLLEEGDKVAVCISELGASKAINLGAYNFALNQLDK